MRVFSRFAQIFGRSTRSHRHFWNLKSGIWDAANSRAVELRKRKLTRWKTQTYAGLTLLAALLWVWPFQLRGDTATPQGSAKTVKQKPHSSSRQSSHKASARTSQARSTRRPATRQASSKARRAAAERRRRAQLRPSPERIQEIQQALAQAGYLNAQPSGRWDEQTREAIRRYQSDHGFPVTGLPEAKSLMKLGLGPHPLPAELDTSSASTPGAATASQPPASSEAQQDPPASSPQP